MKCALATVHAFFFVANHSLRQNRMKLLRHDRIINLFASLFHFWLIISILSTEPENEIAAHGKPEQQMTYEMVSIEFVEFSFTLIITITIKAKEETEEQRRNSCSVRKWLIYDGIRLKLIVTKFMLKCTLWCVSHQQTISDGLVHGYRYRQMSIACKRTDNFSFSANCAIETEYEWLNENCIE